MESAQSNRQTRVSERRSTSMRQLELSVGASSSALNLIARLPPTCCCDHALASENEQRRGRQGPMQMQRDSSSPSGLGICSRLSALARCSSADWTTGCMEETL